MVPFENGAVTSRPLSRVIFKANRSKEKPDAEAGRLAANVTFRQHPPAVLVA